MIRQEGMNSSKKITLSLVACVFCTLIFSQTIFHLIPMTIYSNFNGEDTYSSPEEVIDYNATIILSENSLNFNNYYPESFVSSNGTTGLLKDQNFNLTEYWDWTSTQNISATKTITNLTMFQHYSAGNPIYTSNHSYYASAWDWFEEATISSGDITDT